MHEAAQQQRRADDERARAGARHGSTRRAAAPATPRVATLAGLQHAADGAPSVQRLARTRDSLQRQVTPGAPVAQLMRINGQYIPPTGKRGKELLGKVRLAMFTAGLSPHGSAKKFRELADQNRDYDSDEAFVTRFLDLARDEVLRVEEERRQGRKAKGWTRRLKLGRPGWPDAYKRVVKKGEDIRHIVRNATLKSAIEAERQYQAENHDETTAAQVMNGIAGAVGLKGPYGHSVEATLEIYKAAYLNLGNLFPGPGAINRVIGLTADKITSEGLKLLASQEFATPERITETFEDVAYLVSEVSDQMDRQAEKMEPEQASTFLAGFEEFYDSLTDYLIDREDELLKAASTSPEQAQEELTEQSMDFELNVGVTDAEIGRELIDIGANFGFDIPDEALELPQMQALVKTEIGLASYEPGHPQTLAALLQQFMKIKHVMQV